MIIFVGRKISFQEEVRNLHRLAYLTFKDSAFSMTCTRKGSKKMVKVRSDIYNEA